MIPLATPQHLEFRLADLSASLEEQAALAVGSFIGLPEGYSAEVLIYSEGRYLGRGTLKQSQGHYAVQIQEISA